MPGQILKYSNLYSKVRFDNLQIFLATKLIKTEKLKKTNHNSNYNYNYNFFCGWVWARACMLCVWVSVWVCERAGVWVRQCVGVVFPCELFLFSFFSVFCSYILVISQTSN